MVSVGLSTMTILLVSHLKVYDKHAAGRHPTRFYDSNDAPLVVDPHLRRRGCSVSENWDNISQNSTCTGCPGMNIFMTTQSKAS